MTLKVGICVQKVVLFTPIHAINEQTPCSLVWS